MERRFFVITDGVYQTQNHWRDNLRACDAACTSTPKHPKSIAYVMLCSPDARKPCKKGIDYTQLRAHVGARGHACLL